MKRVLFQCEGASIPPSVLGEPWDERQHIAYTGDAPNLDLRLQNLIHKLRGRVSQHGRDLVRIAAYVFAADQMVHRSGDTDVFGESWPREMHLWIPVDEPDFWSDAEVTARLSDALHWVSGDRWHFGFTPPEYEKGQLVWDLDPAPLRGDPDCVVMLSGGADSLCALVEAVAVHGRRPLVVSHGSSPTVVSRQKELVKSLAIQFPQWQFPSTRVWARLQEQEARERTRRTRAFLFACLGAVVAKAYSLRDVILADNGVVSVHLPTNDQLVGTLASRSTHPKFLWKATRALERFFNEAPRLVNPLWDRTRPECLAVLKATGASPLLSITNSCASQRNLSRETPFCGVCSQCVDRRFGCLAADLEALDPVTRYVVDIFRDELEPGNDRTIALSYYRFALKMEQAQNYDAVLTSFPELADCVLPDDPSPDDTLEELIKMLQKHGADAVSAMEEQIARVVPRMARNQLPEHSLIRMVGEPTRSLAAAGQRVMAPTSEEASLLFITGEFCDDGRNRVLVGSTECGIRDLEFGALMRLVVALFQEPDGMLPNSKIETASNYRPRQRRGGRAESTGLKADLTHQGRGRLRDQLAVGFPGVKMKDVVHSIPRRGVKLELDPKLVRYNRQRLLNHPDEFVREMAGLLPENQSLTA